MLYLLGGATRSGKTTLAHRLLREHQIPFFVTEYLVSALAGGAPQLGVDHEQPDLERAEGVWPTLRPLLANIVEVEPRYLVEGDTLLPHYVHELMQEYPGDIRACFLGYPHISPERKFRDIREQGGGVNDWTQDYPDAYVRELAESAIAFSGILQAECVRYDLPFFDTSEDFLATLAQAYDHLAAPL